MSLYAIKAGLVLGILISILRAGVCQPSSAGELTLAENSRTDYAIVVAGDASAPDKTAARELQSYLRQVTGAEFPIVTEGSEHRTPDQVRGNVQRPSVNPEGREILVGQSKRVKLLLPDVDWGGSDGPGSDGRGSDGRGSDGRGSDGASPSRALGHDGIVIRTVGNRLILAGGKPRGTLYAVYAFLEDTVGVRWWTSTESYIPSRKTLRIPDLNIVYTPKLLYREAYYEDTNANPLFAAKMKLNGHFTAIPQNYGGHYSVLGWCHTSYQLMPPTKYFAAHPDWYAEINGKRSADWGQLCFSNDEMRKELTRNALDWIRQNPTAGIISISQNDWGGNCQCALCKAGDAEEGSPSGSLIRCINKVAEDIEKQYPDMLIETLAYQYTRKPPLLVKPRKNVVIRLCSIECNFGRPLDSDYNASFRDDMRKWSAIAPNLYVWNYVTDFAAFVQPHPNMRALASDIRFFIDNHTIGIFEQADPGCTIGDFDKMRAWLLAHEMWDPSRDQSALMTEFMNGYYGAAGPYLRRYLDLVHDEYEKRPMHLGCYNGDLSFLTYPVMNEAYRLFGKAQEAVKGDSILSARVRRERLVLDHVLLRNYSAYKQASASSPFVGPDDPKKLCAEFVGLAHRYGNRNVTEGQSWDSYVPSLEAIFTVPPTPEELSALPKEDCVVIQESAMQLIGVKEGWIEAVKDPLASDGMAARMPGSHTQWATQYSITDPPRPSEGEGSGVRGKWKCYAVVRCETGDGGGGFQLGIYDNARGFVARMNTFVAKADEGQYKTYYLGSHALGKGMYLYVAPPGDGNVTKGIYTDRFVLVRDK